MIKKEILVLHKKKNKNPYLPPKPLQYNYYFIKLKKENEYMIRELERLNIELRGLIEKQKPYIKNKSDNEKKSLDLSKLKEKKANIDYVH